MQAYKRGFQPKHARCRRREVRSTHEFCRAREISSAANTEVAPRYRSYGAVVVPRVWSVFRKPYKVLLRDEGPNDGLVSVESAKWGQYMGTLVDVDHLDLINWANRARTFVQEVRGKKKLVMPGILLCFYYH